jgi:hypothetical protein
MYGDVVAVVLGTEAVGLFRVHSDDAIWSFPADKGIGANADSPVDHLFHGTGAATFEGARNEDILFNGPFVCPKDHIRWPFIATPIVFGNKTMGCLRWQIVKEVTP